MQDFSTLTRGGLETIDKTEFARYLKHFDNYDSAMRQIRKRVPPAYFNNISSLTLGEQAESTAVIASTMGLLYVLEHKKDNKPVIPQVFIDEAQEMYNLVRLFNVSQAVVDLHNLPKDLEQDFEKMMF